MCGTAEETDEPDIRLGTEESRDDLQGLLEENERWATLGVTTAELVDEVRPLAEELAGYRPNAVVALVAGALTVPDLQQNCQRLEMLVILALRCCAGDAEPSLDDLARWFETLGDSRCTLGEDPSEDGFVFNVHDATGNYLMLAGLWEGAGFAMQWVIDSVALCTGTAFADAADVLRAGLIVSDAVCRRAELVRWQEGAEEPIERLDTTTLPGVSQLASRVLLTPAELVDLGVRRSTLEPLVRTLDDWIADREVSDGTALDESVAVERPFLELPDGRLVLALPSALSVALRRHVMGTVACDSTAEELDLAMINALDATLADVPLLGGTAGAGMGRWDRMEGVFVGSRVLAGETAHPIVVHCIVMPPFPCDSALFGRVLGGPEGIGDALHRITEHATRRLAGSETFENGLVVYVPCSWGPGMTVDPPAMADSRWRQTSLPAADLVRISALPKLSPRKLCKLERQRTKVEAAGVDLVNQNGLLNLFEWARRNGGHLVPHAALPEGRVVPPGRLHIVLPTDLLRQVRREGDLAADRHRIRDGEGIWQPVVRGPAKLLGEADADPIYLPLSALRAGKLVTVSEGQDGTSFQVETRIGDVPRAVRQALWSMVQEWQSRAAPVLLEALEPTPGTALCIDIRFEDERFADGASGPPGELELRGLCGVERKGTRTSVRLASGFAHGFRRSDNLAERIVVEMLIIAAHRATGSAYTDETVATLVRRIVPNDIARSFHAFHARSASEHLGMRLGDQYFDLEEVDDAVLRLGLGWRCTLAPDAGTIEGRDACNAYLAQVVALLIEDLHVDLARFDRRRCVEQFVANAERAQAAELRWERTSAAVIGLHGDGPDTLQTMLESTSRAAGAAIASRVVVEMAVCICPRSGGRPPSESDLSRLATLGSLVVRMGQMSDAIRYRAVPARIRISALGDVLFEDDFTESVVLPTTSRYRSERFAREAERYAERYLPPPRPSEGAPSRVLEPAFHEAWREEFGVSLDECLEILGAVDDHAVTLTEPLSWTPRSELVRIASTRTISEESALRFLDAFVLPSRARWDVIPEGFRASDIQPWRYDRRLSLVTRPLPMLEDTADPEILLVPSLLMRSFTHVLSSIYHGAFDKTFFVSDAMGKRWRGQAGDGHGFNRDAVRDLERRGWTVRIGRGLPEILNRKMARNFGDVDILAWRAGRNEVWAIECKDLGFTRTPAEMARMLSDYQGVDKAGKPDRLLKHLRRVEQLREHATSLARYVDMADPEVHAALLFSDVVPMTYSDAPALADVFVGSVEDFLARRPALEEEPGETGNVPSDDPEIS